MSGKRPVTHCSVVGPEKLRPGLEICSEIQRAIAKAAPRASYGIEVRVLPKARLKASLTVNGRALAEQNFAVMDSELSADAVRRFAASIAKVVADAAKSAID